MNNSTGLANKLKLMMMTTIFSSKTVSDLTESIIQIQQQLMYKGLPLFSFKW